jgi:hypothetical protein
MWELVEMIVYYFKYKKWPLPLFLVFILIIIAFAISIPRQSLIAPVSQMPQEVIDNKNDSNKPTQEPPVRKKNNEHQQDVSEKIGNISHFKNLLTDTLKVEGLDLSVSQKIFHHMRKQLSQEKGSTPYELADSVRAALPEASEEEINRIRDLVSEAATQSLGL